MHREIMRAPKGTQVDHEDGDGLNNRRRNLRFSTFSQNNHNRGPYKRNTSGFKGVSWSSSKKRWEAHIQVAGKHLHLGRFRNKLDAAKAYEVAAKKYLGEFARTKPFGDKNEDISHR